MSQNQESHFPEGEIVTFYDSSGRAVFYLNSDGEYFYHYDGTPLGYLYGDCIVDFSGRYLGWIYNGSIIDYTDGSYAFFTQHSSGGPTRPMKQMRPMRSMRQMRPMKGMKEMRPMKPMRSSSWSSRSSEAFFPNY